MSGILRISLKVALAAALLLIGTGAAHAQYWPITTPLRCNWTRSSGGTVTGAGTATINFSYTSINDPYSRSGNLTSRYPDGSVLVRPFTIYWDFYGGYDWFIFDQTYPRVYCNPTRTFDSGSIVVFEACDNGVFQYCRP